MSVAGEYDVDARLARGRAAVDDIGEYVRACHQLGYQHPDLTTHTAQVRDWYAGEDGMQLDALAADAATLTAVAAATDDAVRRQSELLATLSGAWAGQGAGVALDFLMRHQRTAVMASAAVRDAADTLTALRDELWHAIDAKVAATAAVDARQQGQRDVWLAAARAVNTGSGDRATASELVDQHVKPFVDNDVRLDWLDAMRRCSAAVMAAYHGAIARLRATPGAVFEVPGDLGPRLRALDPLPAPAVTAPAAAVDASPLVVSSGTPVAAPAPMSVPASPPLAPPPLSSPMTPPVDPMPTASGAPTASPMPGLGELGGATPSLGSGSSGFGQQLADLIGGLVGSSGEPTSDEPDFDEPDDEIESTDPAAESDPEEAVEVEEELATPESEPEPEPEPELEPVAEPEPAPAATPVAPPPEAALPSPTAVPEAMPEGQTPCEIAADELPQVGP